MKDNDRRHVVAGMMMTLMALLSQPGTASASDTLAHKTPPVPVVFGVQALTPEVPVNAKVAFVSQMLTLPGVVCEACTAQDSWTRHWSASPLTLDRRHTQAGQGWYVFSSGLEGIAVGIQAAPDSRQTAEGKGARSEDSRDITVGLVRTGRHTGAGLAALPASGFTRVTTFRGPDGTVKYVQEDTVRVSADFRVATCTSTTGSLSFRLPDVERGWLRQNIAPGHYADTQGSAPQLVMSNCSENTRSLRIRFIPAGSVATSVAGPATILVGRDEQQQDTGVGFLMTYDAEGFGHRQQGVVHWDRAWPLELTNPAPTDSGDALSEGITVSMQTFYARPDNGLPLRTGQITAKGLYQVSYE